MQWSPSWWMGLRKFLNVISIVMTSPSRMYGIREVCPDINNQNDFSFWVHALASSRCESAELQKTSAVTRRISQRSSSFTSQASLVHTMSPPKPPSASMHMKTTPVDQPGRLDRRYQSNLRPIQVDVKRSIRSSRHLHRIDIHNRLARSI